MIIRSARKNISRSIRHSYRTKILWVGFLPEQGWDFIRSNKTERRDPLVDDFESGQNVIKSRSKSRKMV